MGKTILTSKQLNFLELVQGQSSITKRFFLTGGTALSEFYFKHRLSEDIDLFSEEEVNPQVIQSFLKSISSKLGISEIIEQNILGLFTYKLRYKDGDFLKVDFSYYPFPKIEKGVNFKKLEISSVYDIAVNKVHTIGMKARSRDYVDLYFIFKNSSEDPAKYLQRMQLDSRAKFDWPLEAKNLIASLLRVKDIKPDDLPTMLVPFNKADMENFFLQLVKSLENEIFKD